MGGQRFCLELSGIHSPGLLLLFMPMHVKGLTGVCGVAADRSVCLLDSLYQHTEDGWFHSRSVDGFMTVQVLIFFRLIVADLTSPTTNTHLCILLIVCLLEEGALFEAARMSLLIMLPLGGLIEAV